MHTIIVANSAIHWSSQVRKFLAGADQIIAADGGARHCLAVGITPAVVIGDFDSLDEAFLDHLQAQGVKLVRYPVEKDFTDLELAIQYAVLQGAKELIVLGALGERWDQTIANLLLPALQALRGVTINLVDGTQTVRLLQGGGRMVVRGKPGDTLSLIPLSEQAAGISTQGLRYPLYGEALYLGSTRGVSNELTDETAFINLEQGLLLCVVIHQSVD